MRSASESHTGEFLRATSPRASDGFPLSPIQQGMLFHWLLDRHSGNDIEQIVGHLDEPIDPARLAAAWQEAVDHFGALRTAFVWEGQDTSLQFVLPSAKLDFSYRDLRTHEVAERERLVQEFLRSDRRTGIDLSLAPGMRVMLFQLEDARFQMVWTFHHILLDGRAFDVILRDVFATYAGATEHAHADRSFRDFVEWNARQETVASRAFWRERLAGFTTPVPLPAPSGSVAAGSDFVQADLLLSKDSTRRLRALASREKLSLNTIVLGAWALLLSRYGGTTDVVFGATKSTRRGSLPGAEAMVGIFLSTIPVRVRMDPSLPVVDWLRQVGAEWRALRGHEHLPLVDIRAESDVPPSVALFESLVMFDTTQLDTTLRAQGGAWEHRRFTTREQTGFPLTLLAYGDDELLLRIEFDARRMDAEAARQWHSELAGILNAWSLDVTRPLSDTPCLSGDDGVVAACERTVAEAPSVAGHVNVRDASDGTVHAQIERQIERTPDAIAASFGDEEVTYRELNRRANAVAAELRRRGAGPETLVGICVDRSIEMLVGLLGILKAGGAYVPLDPAYPTERITLMLDDARVHTVVTQRHLVGRVASRAENVLLVDDPAMHGDADAGNADVVVTPGNLAYVIFTSGSTGRPKGTMIEHRNVTNLFRGMDEVLGTAPGVWLAVTSISFDISVLELFWTLARGYRVVIAPAFDRASAERHTARPATARRAMDFGLFYFAAHAENGKTGDAYRLLLDGARFADTHGFTAVWTPERHFHAFGGFYPNPAVTTAALSTITSRVQLRAGSIVLPLHNPLRVAEDWAVIDQLSGGRVGLSFASGWHVNDFAFMPENYARRREVMAESIDTVLRLWRGESVAVTNGAGEMIDVKVLPRPVQERPPIWIASAGSAETFVLAGRLGANILTNMLGQDLADLTEKFAAYRAARREHGHKGDGIITVMLHTFVTDDSDEARRLVRKPFCDYLASSFDLVKVAPTMFPAFRQPSRTAAGHESDEPLTYTDDDMAALLDHAFDRYFDTAGLFGTPERAVEMVDRLAEAGATEVACLIDFGVDADLVLESLPHLDRLRRMCAERSPSMVKPLEHATSDFGRLIREHGITHLQCTPSVARAIAEDPDALQAMRGLEALLLGGEVLPADLGSRFAATVRGKVFNMYGPTETTVWSTTSPVMQGAAPTIGRPIANTTVHVLDERQHPVARGTPGELYVGGHGVVRGYLDRPELTRERFVPDPSVTGGRLYRTGDIARMRADGVLEYLGRVDEQVKVNGYRIELGEIEATLLGHAAVRECVVVARHSAKRGADAAISSLAAYVVPSSSITSGDEGGDDERVRHWEHIWSETYERAQTVGGAADPRFMISGWNDSYTGLPFPEAEMREWLQATVDRILALAPRRVLEVGCGTGMILYKVLPHVEHYTGVDIAAAGLECIRRELREDEAPKVTLLQGHADSLASVPDRSVDFVVINSVAQYFPSADYLVRVLRRASELVTDGGSIFVGDVRSLEHLKAFHTSLELHQAPADLHANELEARIDNRVAHEGELVLSPAFFDTLAADTPRVTGAEVELKRGTAHNELTAFRYDVTLHVGQSSRVESSIDVQAVTATHLADVERLLESAPMQLSLCDLPNARLCGVSAVQRAMEAGEPSSAGALRDLLTDGVQGIDPEALCLLNDQYDARLTWAASGDPSRFDAILQRRNGTRAQRCRPASRTVSATHKEHANIPARRRDKAVLFSQLRAHLRRTLPDYMIPTSFVLLNELPLTPNGKIDRKALPLPDEATPRAAAAYVAPAGELEQQIADIWRDLLAISNVGRQDNFFELGANSLLTMQANSRLSALLGRSVPLVSMFRFPTVASLAAHLGTQGDGAATRWADKRAHDRATRSEQAAERRRALRTERGER